MLDHRQRVAGGEEDRLVAGRQAARDGEQPGDVAEPDAVGGVEGDRARGASVGARGAPARQADMLGQEVQEPLRPEPLGQRGVLLGDVAVVEARLGVEVAGGVGHLVRLAVGRAVAEHVAEGGAGPRRGPPPWPGGRRAGTGGAARRGAARRGRAGRGSAWCRPPRRRRCAKLAGSGLTGSASAASPPRKRTSRSGSAG